MNTQLSVVSSRLSVISGQLLVAGHGLRGKHAFGLHDRPVPFLIVGWSRTQGFVKNSGRSGSRRAFQMVEDGYVRTFFR
jgi:hypothetical protein